MKEVLDKTDDKLLINSSVQEWLSLLCERTPGVLVAALYARKSTGHLHVLATLPSGAVLPECETLVRKSLEENRVIQQDLGENRHLKAHPVAMQDGFSGTAVLLIHAPAAATTTVRGEGIPPLMHALAHRGAVTAEQGSESVPSFLDAVMTPTSAESSAHIAWAEVIEIASAALAYTEAEAAASALLQALRQRFGCDRVSLGIVADEGVRIAACMPSVDIVSQRSLFQAIAAAMDECTLQNAVVALPQHAEQAPQVIAAHTVLARLSGARALLSVPLPAPGDGMRVSAVLCLERGEGQPFTADEAARLHRMAGVLGPITSLFEAARPRGLRRVHAAIAKRLQRYGISPQLLKPIAGVGVALLLIVLILPVPYRLASPARVEGLEQRALVAPNDGFLKVIHARPGDVVKQDAVLAEMAREELLLSERKWASELAQAESAFGNAMAGRDRSQVVMQVARIEEATAQLTLVRQQLERTQLRAPFEGVVIEGDLSQSLGAPLKRGDVLMRIAPVGRWRVIIEVDERDISRVSLGSAGELLLQAQPNTPIPLHIKRITPMATTRDGRTFYEVEAEPGAAALTQLRPGMTGIARLHGERRALGSMWVQRAFDALRYFVWAHVG